MTKHKEKKKGISSCKKIVKKMTTFLNSSSTRRPVWGRRTRNVESRANEDDYEVVTWYSRSVSLPLDTRKVTLCVLRKEYDRDLRAGMPSRLVVQRQFNLDRPRSDFQSDGPVSPSLLPYCTQAVMALPIEAIARGGTSRIVAERIPSRPMIVRVKEGTVLIDKPLRVVEGYDSRQIRIRIKVGDPLVLCEVMLLSDPA